MILTADSFLGNTVTYCYLDDCSSVATLVHTRGRCVVSQKSIDRRLNFLIEDTKHFSAIVSSQVHPLSSKVMADLKKNFSLNLPGTEKGKRERCQRQRHRQRQRQRQRQTPTLTANRQRHRVINGENPARIEYL